MSSPPVHSYPIVVLEDRYGGCYSGGQWLAIAEADAPVADNGQSRVAWAMGDEGPSGCDLAARLFWQAPPCWISAGQTPDDAIAGLINNKEFQRRF